MKKNKIVEEQLATSAKVALSSGDTDIANALIAMKLFMYGRNGD